MVDRTAASHWGRAVVLATTMVLAGCTMCPDPYDYSGPVPNGSAPQNDFRARSNGILPLGAAPMPWPPIVKIDGTAGEATRLAGRRPTGVTRNSEPTLADASVEPASASAEGLADDVVSVLLEQDDASPAVSPSVMPVAGESDDDTPSAEAEAGDRPPVESEIDGSTTPCEGAPTPAVSVELPGLSETPGWRMRHGR